MWRLGNVTLKRDWSSADGSINEYVSIHLFRVPVLYFLDFSIRTRCGHKVDIYIFPLDLTDFITFGTIDLLRRDRLELFFSPCRFRFLFSWSGSGIRGTFS